MAICKCEVLQSNKGEALPGWWRIIFIYLFIFFVIVRIFFIWNYFYSLQYYDSFQLFLFLRLQMLRISSKSFIIFIFITFISIINNTSFLGIQTFSVTLSVPEECVLAEFLASFCRQEKVKRLQGGVEGSEGVVMIWFKEAKGKGKGVVLAEDEMVIQRLKGIAAGGGGRVELIVTPK